MTGKTTPVVALRSYAMPDSGNAKATSKGHTFGVSRYPR